METIAQIILLGKGIERLKILYKFYLIIASAWVMNILMISLNINISRLMSVNDSVSVFFSTEGIIIFSVFIFCYVVLSFYGKILIFIGSFLMPLFFRILMYLILVPKFIFRILIFRKPKNIFTFNDEDKIGIIREFKNFPNFLSALISFNECDFDNSAKIFSFFSSIYFIFILYKIDRISNVLYLIAAILCVFYFLNSSFLAFIMRKRKEIIELIIKSELNLNEPNRDNK